MIKIRRHRIHSPIEIIHTSWELLGGSQQEPSTLKAIADKLPEDENRTMEEIEATAKELGLPLLGAMSILYKSGSTIYINCFEKEYEEFLEAHSERFPWR